MKILDGFFQRQWAVNLHCLKKDGAKAFDFQSDAYYGKVKGGMMTHANIRKDKNDLFPQDEVMDMILSL